jgi:general secretion pathway protein K
MMTPVQSRWPSRPPISPARSPGEDGFIVVAVLWVLLALATLASIYSIYIANSAMALSATDDGIQTQALVSSSLELTAYRLLAPDKDKRPIAGRFQFRLGRAVVAVNFSPENARVDLNAAPKPMLAALFGTLGVQNQDAERYADRIIGWRTAPKPGQANAEDPLYLSAGLSYAPRGAPFAHVDELWLVQGLAPAFIDRVMPFVTVYSGRPEINVFSAAPEVVAALPGMTPQRLNGFLDKRDSVPPNADSISSLLGPDQTSATAEGSDVIRVRARIAFDNGRQTTSEVVILMGEDDEPFRVMYWRDDVETAQIPARAATRSR